MAKNTPPRFVPSLLPVDTCVTNFAGRRLQRTSYPSKVNKDGRRRPRDVIKRFSLLPRSAPDHIVEPVHWRVTRIRDRYTNDLEIE